MKQNLLPGNQGLADDSALDRVALPRPARRLGRHHFAFVRAFLEGLALARSADLYLETGSDRRAAKATLKWVLSELIAAARRERPAMARLLRIPPERLKPPPADEHGEPITLEDFAADRDPSGFYTEAELIALYEEALAKTRARPPREQHRIERNAGLRQRQIDAVRWLEGWIAQTPRAQDPVVAWLDPVIAERLEATGIETLQALLDLINRRGRRWWSKVPKLGPKGAALLQRWIQMNRIAIGADVEASALVPYKERVVALRRARCHEFGIVPMEFLAIPEELSGRLGRNRSFGDALAAQTDLDAINAWLATRKDKPHTLRSYRTNVERFVLWALVERQKALSSLTIEDCADYRDWLAALDPDARIEWRWRLPREVWIGPRSAGRFSPQWRPFAGPLQPVSQNLARTICLSMCEWLRKKHYLATNPWDGVSERIPAVSEPPVARSLSPSQWKAVKDYIEAMAMDERGLRLRFALWFAATTGLRLSEMAQATLGAIQPGPTDPELGRTWELVVIGKRNKRREVPIPSIVMDYLLGYLEARGVAQTYPNWPANEPLLATLGKDFQMVAEAHQPISASAIYGMLVRLFDGVADHVQDLDWVDADRLRAASVHWLRHTMARSALDSGADIRDVMLILGHADISTTQRYVTTGRRVRQRTVAKLALALQKPDEMPS